MLEIQPVSKLSQAACTELLGALLGAVALENGEPSSAESSPKLFRALELLGDPLRSKAVNF